MIGIAGVGTYLPPGRESNFDKQEKFQIDPPFIREKLGVETVARMGQGQDSSDMCVEAFKALQARRPVDPATIDCVVVCTQNPDGNGIPHTSAVVHGKLGLPERCAAFDISLGCSGYVYALSVVKAFMEAQGLRNGLLFTADPYSKILDPEDKNTVLLFGDAATATHLRAPAGDERLWTPVRFAFGTRGKDGAALCNSGGRLAMNGRAVFAFSATTVPPQVRDLLAGAAIEASQVDLFLFHQGSRYIVDTLVQRLGLPPEKVPFEIFQYGNTVSSSIPLLLAVHMDDPGVARMLMSGFGVGLSWASCLLERRGATQEDQP